MKTGFQIVSLIVHIPIVMRAAFADISVPLIPWIILHDPTNFFIFFNSKGFYYIASIFDAN